MARLIDADALVDQLREQAEHQWFGSIEARMHFCDKVMFAIDCVSEAPAIDAAPVRRGEWKHTEHNEYVVCSYCGIDRNIYTQASWNFCPYCGADMRGETHGID